MPIASIIDPYHMDKLLFSYRFNMHWFHVPHDAGLSHFENALRFKHIELCGVRVHRSVLTLYIDDYSSIETRSHCLAFHVFSLSHHWVPTGDPDQRAPEDKTSLLALSVFCDSRHNSR